ncbi:hypothetical protein ACTQ54_01290 [Fundicoccus sp. Sow4_H7]|uniref:hypothetical protein n=1 Tax=Fundicoccus sp. Sow4_H7 TaxID=3438784 RepID=UPI003F907E1B
MRRKYQFPLAFLCLLFIIVAVLLYYFNLKQGYHVDEIYTYGLSNSYYQPMPFDFNQWLDGSYYLNYLSPTAEVRFAYDSVIYNQIQDVHPPLYYFFIHTISSFFPGVFTKWIGLSFNGFVHLLIFLVLLMLLKQLSDKKWVALIGASFWALSKGALSSAVFIRMYHLLTLWEVILLYLLVLYVSKLFNQKSLLFGLALICYFGGLTHYYFYIYAFLLVAVACIYLFLQGRWKDGIQVGLVALLGIGLALASFPTVFTHLFASNRGVEVLENANQFQLDRSNPFLVFIKQELLLNIRLRYVVLLGIILAVFMVFYFYKRRQFSQISGFVLVMLPTLLYILLIQELSHYQTPRYIYSVYPMIIVSLVLLLYYGLKGIFSLINITFIAEYFVNIVLAIGIIFSLTTTLPEYLFLYKPSLVSLIENSTDQTIFVLSDQYWKVAREVDDLPYFYKVYASVITNSLTNLPEQVEEDKLYVLMQPNEKNDYQKVVHSIAAKYQMEVVTEVFVEQDEILYQLVRK